MAILTKSDVKFDEIRVFRVTTLDDQGKEVTKWYVNVGYRVLTAEGEEFNRDKQIEIKGTNLTEAKAFFDKIVAAVKAEEGI